MYDRDVGTLMPVGWVDRALMTLSPADVAERVNFYVQNVPIEESYDAMRRALPRMTPQDLAQVAIAFDVPIARDVQTGKRVLFDEGNRQTGVLAHFLTIPDNFEAGFARFLSTHPRALACFEDADASRILQLSSPRDDRAPRTYAARPLLGTIAAIVVLAGFSLGALLALLAHQHHKADNVAMAHRAPAANSRTATPLAATTAAAPSIAVTASPAAAATVRATPSISVTARIATPSPAAQAPPTQAAVAQTQSTVRADRLQGRWQVNEANVEVGSIVWSGGATARGNSIVLDLHKASVGGRSAMPCERQTNLQATLSPVAPQTVPYREINCQGVASAGELRVDRFSSEGDFQGSFWQNGMKLGDFDARKP